MRFCLFFDFADAAINSNNKSSLLIIRFSCSCSSPQIIFRHILAHKTYKSKLFWSRRLLRWLWLHNFCLIFLLKDISLKKVFAMKEKVTFFYKESKVYLIVELETKRKGLSLNILWHYLLYDKRRLYSFVNIEFVQFP